ncbi:NACHT domain-containing protein [Myxococcota bacterium]|nr:NACHT domain-containing protein [Myxococcota bacterium]
MSEARAPGGALLDDALRQDLEQLEPGFAALTCSPGQEAGIARSVAALFQGAAVVAPDQLAGAPATPTLVLAGAPSDADLPTLNGRRDLLTAHGLRIVLVLDGAGRQRLSALAGDLCSVLQVDATVPYLPQPVNPEPALAAWWAWLRERYGRLDLRGFSRGEADEPGWEVLDVYEGLRAARTVTRQGVAYVHEAGPLDPPGGLHRVLLGHPGAGKTFFLRWLSLAHDRRAALLGPAGELPVLSSLSTYARLSPRADLFEHLRDQLLARGLQVGHLLQPLAEQGRVCFLLDGLDEGGDLSTRQRLVAQVVALQRRFPTCAFVLTSRVTGYDQAPLPWPALTLQPLDDGQVRAFLERWCGLAAARRTGAVEQGRAEGRALAEQILASPPLAALARSPLLLTVMATVHGAGQRLPDHRVELYDHLTRILVERWNRHRALQDQGRAPPVRLSDAVRLLGPLALEVIARGQAGAIPEDLLRASLQRSARAGGAPVLGDVDQALGLFRDELGLLVEQGPGTWAFLHMTLAEYLAAWELARGEGLEQRVADPTRAFLAPWREVLLLAAGVLGVLRAEDARLDRVVEALVRGARTRAGRASAVVPAVLAGLLADDPALSAPAAALLVEELVPRWWFQRFGSRVRAEAVAQEAARSLGPRVLAGRHGPALRQALDHHLARDATAAQRRALGRAGPVTVGLVIELLRHARLDPSPLLLAMLSAGGREREAARLAWTVEGHVEEDGALRLWVPTLLDRGLCAAEPRLLLHVQTYERRRGAQVFRARAVQVARAALLPAGEREGFEVELRGRLAPPPAGYERPAQWVLARASLPPTG